MLVDLAEKINPVLECPPKWKLLKQIIKEIKNNNKTKNNNTYDSNNNDNNNNNRVLLIVRDDLAVVQLKDFLSDGDESVMDQRYRLLLLLFVVRYC